MDSLYNWVILNGIVLLNVIMGFIEAVCDKVDVAVKAIRDSSVSDILIFIDRNEFPWLFKENALPVLKGSNLLYSMNDKKFYLNTYRPESFIKMDDIIMAELVDASGGGVCDMSELLHSVKWSSVFSPTVYELVLVNLLVNKICISTEFLSTCVLNVTTLENPFLEIKMSNPLVKNNFTSWTAFTVFNAAEPSVASAVAEPLVAEPLAAEPLDSST
jgi:hypothetical protein